jgi:hypothetical protein
MHNAQGRLTRAAADAHSAGATFTQEAYVGALAYPEAHRHDALAPPSLRPDPHDAPSLTQQAGGRARQIRPDVRERPKK